MVHFKIQDVTFAYPDTTDRPALEHINLEIRQGEYVTVCGASGSGKTTLLRLLKSVLTPHGTLSGEILFCGRPLQEADLREQSSKIGYVMQNPDSQIVTDKVWHELAFGLESLGYDQKTIRLRVAEMASYFGIEHWFYKNVSELSGGQKQLLNLASVMAMQPEVLILDEPTSQLDPIAAADFLNTVKKINRELRTTVIITEHRLEDIFYASDQVVVMEKGKIAAVDTPRAVGAFLKEGNHEMLAALPTPLLVYYGVEEQKNSAPLTVREGAEWLDTFFADRTLKVSAYEAEAPYEEDEIKDPAVEVKELYMRYEKNAPDILKGVSFRVEKGTLFAIVGGNGTGKSTLLRSICGICRPYSGKVKIFGKRMEKYRKGELFSGNLAMLPQDPLSLFVKKTVREDLEEMTTGKNKKDREDEITHIAKLCQITELLEKHPYDISGGEQQRAALAKVLLTQPQILLLDEPTKGMDAIFKKQFADILKELNNQGITIILVSHDVEFCAKYADTVSMFFDGTILTTNTPRNFFSKNSFYTTAANRMSRHIFENAVTDGEVIELCQKNL